MRRGMWYHIARKGIVSSRKESVMGGSKKYKADDTYAAEKAAQEAAANKANAEAAAKGNSGAEGGQSMFDNGALSRKKAKAGSKSTLAGEGGSTFTQTGTLGG